MEDKATHEGDMRLRVAMNAIGYEMFSDSRQVRLDAEGHNEIAVSREELARIRRIAKRVLKDLDELEAMHPSAGAIRLEEEAASVEELQAERDRAERDRGRAG